MNKLVLLPALIACLALWGCAASHETLLNTEPRGYDEAMDMLASQIRTLDKHVIGAQYEQAVPEAERVMNLAAALGRTEPARLDKSLAEYEEYLAQAEDMRHAADRLLYYVQQRRRNESRSQLEVVANRFNTMSTRYGPNYQIGVLDRGPNKLMGPEDYRGNMPGELRGNR